MNRSTKKIFKFIYNNPSGMSLSVLYKEFPNHTIVTECYKSLIKQELIANHNGSIELTSDGYDYYHNLWKNRIINILTKFIIPILIAILSSVITARFISSTEECKCNVTCNYTNDYNDDNIYSR